MMMVAAVRRVVIDRWTVDFVNHDRRGRFPNDDGFGLPLPRRFLHRCHDPAAHSLLTQVDQILRAWGLHHTIGTDMVDNQLLVDAALSHHDDVFGGNSTGTELTPQLGLDLSTILGLDGIDFRADDGTTQGSNTRPYGSSCPRVARGVPDQGSRPGTNQAAQKGSLVCPMG